jgi:hypothetical protein
MRSNIIMQAQQHPALPTIGIRPERPYFTYRGCCGPGRGAPLMSNVATVNRAPVLTLRATVVAERVRFTQGEGKIDD